MGHLDYKSSHVFNLSDQHSFVADSYLLLYYVGS